MSNAVMKLEYNQEQVSLIKSQIAPKATNDELKLFLYQCQRTGLDALSRQIYAIHRKAKDSYGNWVEKMTIQTSIDGFRVIAERSGDYGGQDEPVYGKDENGELFCKVTVYRFRGTTRYPASVGVAFWKEYVPKEGQDNMWKKMPHTMLAKVAEALALRKAYPQDLSGLYTTDEMQQANTTIQDTTAEVLTPEQQDSWQYEMWMQQKLQSLLDNSGYEGKHYQSILSNINADKNMTEELYKKIKTNLELNQRNRIHSGDNYSQSDISQHMAATMKE